MRQPSDAGLVAFLLSLLYLLCTGASRRHSTSHRTHAPKKPHHAKSTRHHSTSSGGRHKAKRASKRHLTGFQSLRSAWLKSIYRSAFKRHIKRPTAKSHGRGRRPIHPKKFHAHSRSGHGHGASGNRHGSAHPGSKKTKCNAANTGASPGFLLLESRLRGGVFAFGSYTPVEATAGAASRPGRYGSTAPTQVAGG